MARISGGAKDRLINEGFMNASAAWTDETTFGINYTPNRTMAMERSRRKLHSIRTNELCRSSILQQHGQLRRRHTVLHQTQQLHHQLTSQEAYIGGLETSPFQYGGIVPLVAIYKIDWNAYYAATGTTGPT